jgi:hypothetical protein
MTYAQVERAGSVPASWHARSMAPASLLPAKLLRDYWMEVWRFRASRLPIRLGVAFSFLWLLQRLAYWWGWHSTTHP